MRSWARVHACRLLVFIACVPCLAEVSTAQLPPGVHIKTDVQPQEATVGDPIRIMLDLSLPRGDQIRLPELGGQIGDFTVLEFHPGPTIPGVTGASGPPASRNGTATEGTKHHYALVVVALYKTGDFTFPAIQMVLRNPDGKEATLASPQIKIRIHSVLAQNDSALKDLKKQADIQEPRRWLVWLGIALLVAGLGIIAWRLWQRRRTSSPMITAPRINLLERAESELRALVSRGLLEKGQVKPFYIALSDIVKDILEGGYGVHTVEKTTAEIVEELRSAPNGGPVRNGMIGTPPDLDLISRLLSTCDLVKFARYLPSQSESDTAVHQAWDLLEACKKLKASLSAPEPTRAGAA